MVVEALDAGGSQTQSDRLSAWLKRERFNVLELHFPHEDRATGRMIYDKYLLNHNKRPFSRREQALLYIQDFYSRAEDIIGHLRGKRSVVVSDRFCTSTMVYQTAGLSGAARRAMAEWIDWLCWQGTPVLPRPDVVVFIDTPVEVVLRRLADKKKDHHERRAKLIQFRNSYLRVAREQGWVVVSGVDEDGREKSRAALGREISDLVRGYL